MSTLSLIGFVDNGNNVKSHQIYAFNGDCFEPFAVSLSYIMIDVKLDLWSLVL